MTSTNSSTDIARDTDIRGISIRNASYVYRNEQTGATVNALDNIDLEIQPGSFVCILGPSGCGKSTLLSMIAGLRLPTSGQIIAGGGVVRGPSADRGMVFQQYALLPWKTVLNNVALGLKYRGVHREERLAKARDLLAMVGLEGFENKHPHELSGGMQQRVAVARALAPDPAILLLDEPLAAVDAQTRASLQEEIRAISNRAGVTCVFVTHSVEEALFLGDVVVVMSARPGRVHSLLETGLGHERRWSQLEHSERFFHLKAELGDTMRAVIADKPTGPGR